MDNGTPYGRRKAKAVAISQAIEAHRKAGLAKLMLALGAIAIMAETLSIAHRVWVVSHP